MNLRGLQGPLQRGPNDFLVLEGNEYVNNRIETLVSIHTNPFEGTGELEWDQERGFMTEFLRHRNTTRGRLEVLTLHGAEQLRKWEPDLKFIGFRYVRRLDSEAVELGIRWDHKRLAETGTAKVEIVK